MKKEYSRLFLAGARFRGHTPEEHEIFLAQRQEEEKKTARAEMPQEAEALGLTEHEYFGTDPESW